MSQSRLTGLCVLQALNQGIGEGIFYRGRILLALCVEVYSSPAAVNVEMGSAAMGKVQLTSCVLFFLGKRKP